MTADAADWASRIAEELPGPDVRRLARPWRGQQAAAANGRIISAAVAQSTVLSLRNMLDDIAAWGWAEAPPRRLVFAADVPNPRMREYQILLAIKVG